MKKIIMSVLLLSLSMTMSACEINKSPGTNDGFIAENVLLTVESFLGYKKFLRTADLPIDFIAYDNISEFGDFESFICLSDAGVGDFSSYMYHLVDENDYRLTLYIDHNNSNEIPESTIAATSILAKDMRKLDEKLSGSYAKEEFSYYYISGELLSITWTHEGITYKLCGDSMLSDYPSTEKTIAGKLLNLDNAPMIKDSLCQ
jgi:hypothetical protein